jgi:ABC-2 type transport system permease protein
MNTRVNTMKWLLRREFWEHKGAFFWAPVVIGAALVAMLGGGFLYSMAVTSGLDMQVDGHHVVAVNGIPHTLRHKLADIVASSYMAVSAPLFLVLPVVVFFYCLAALYDDRRDRSILFWKSLPLSDQETVLSKAAMALLVAPLITFAVGCAASLALLAIGLAGSAVKGLNLIAPVLADGNLYLSPLYLLGFLPLYILFALPTVGWLMLVSSWARSKPFLWAVGTPLAAIAVLKWVDFLLSRFGGLRLPADWFIDEVVARGLGGLVPAIWLADMDNSVLREMDRGLDGTLLLAHSYSALASPGVWLGAIAGVAMLFAASRLRRWRDEG